MKLALGILALALLAGTASADSTWTYTGNTISYAWGTNPGPIGVNPCGCALDGFVTLDASGAVTGYSFTAGNDTLTQSNSTGLLGNDVFYVFDPADNYFRWGFDLVGQGVEMFSSFDGSYSDSGDYSSGGLNVYADPGKWTDPVSTPEPGTIALVGLGLAVLALLRRLA
jgi:hypothetical protein